MRRRTLLSGIALGLVGAAWIARAMLDRSGQVAAPVQTPGATATRVATTPADSPVAPAAVPRGADEPARAERAAPAPAPPIAGRTGSRSSRATSETVASTSISGRVSTPSGLALEAVMVSAAPDSRRKATKVWTRTDADGHFEFDVPQRFDLVYRVQVGGTTEDRTLRRLIQSLKGQGELRVDDVEPGRDDLHFVIPVPGSLALIAIDGASGASLTGLTVESRLADEPDFHPHGWGLQRLPIDEHGRFTIGLPAGPIVLRMSEPGYVPIERAFVVPPTRDPLPEVVEFEACARVELAIRMSPGTTPGDFNDQLGSFVPRDDLGRPLYKATVMLLNEEEHERYVQADAVSVDDLWLKKLSGRLKREGRIFEEEEDGVRAAWPPPGQYHLAAYPRQTRFDPPTLAIGSVDLRATATAGL